ncbi:MAG: ribosome assembly RNA-binding protein YhbY [Calditrichia bacterium]
MALTGKEKRSLRSEANHLKPEVWIGKEGIGKGTLQTLENSFQTKELVKIKLLESSPQEKEEAARELSAAAGAEIVQILGNTILLFRPLPEETP